MPLVGVVWKVNGRPSTSTPHGANTIGGNELKIGRINYLGGLTMRVKFHLSPPFSGSRSKSVYWLHKRKWSPWITVSKTVNCFRIGWTIIEKLRCELDLKWTHLCVLLSTRSSWWRHFRWKCKDYWRLCCIKFLKLLALVASEKIKISHLRNAPLSGSKSKNI